MALLINHWIAPIIDSDTGLRRALIQSGSVYRIADTVPVILMFIGGAFLLSVAYITATREGNQENGG